MGKIFCIGQSAYDITVPLSEPIIENQKYRITEKLECGGGPAFNSACLCGLWGADVSLISRIGEDGYGRKLWQIAEKCGVDLGHLIPDHEIETPHSFIFANRSNGSRTLFNFPGVQKDIVYQLPEEEVSVILSDGHEPKISLAAIEKYSMALSVVDAGTCRESTLEVAKASDYLVCSEDFARQYTGKTIDLQDWNNCEKIFREVEKINGKYVVITLGERGLLYRICGEMRHLPAYPAQAKDTTGAGDIFHGAFAYGLWKELPLVDILKLSSMAASLSVRKLGSQTSIPALMDVEQELYKES